MKEELKVSVYCQTYNQVSYIKSALDGFLMQDTDFPFEVVVYDDASTDGTSDIVREYADKYPDIIRAFIMEKNTWHVPERAKIALEFRKKYLKGKYTAYCEGDDFWIDRHKLQIQVDYMETHPECSMYVHNALWVDCRDGTMKAGNPYISNGAGYVSPKEIIMLENGHPPTASFLHRKEMFDSMPQWFNEAAVGDYTLLLYAITCGNVYYNDRIMSVYRNFAVGSYTTTRKKDPYLTFYYHFGVTGFCIKYNQYTDYKYYKWLAKMIELFASPLLHDPEMNQSIEKYVNACIEQGYCFFQDYRRYMNALIQMQKQIYDKTYVASDVMDFLEQQENVVIMGAGKYAAVLAEQFVNNRIEFQGFAVSHREKGMDTYLGKPVWSLDDLPFENVGIVVGISSLDWEGIIESLRRADITNYYWPFLLDVKEEENRNY